MEETKNPVTGIGVPDGDGGSLEREDAREDTNTNEEDIEKGMNEDDEDSSTLEDDDSSEASGEDDLAIAERSNSLGNDTDNGRRNESVEGAMNNPGVATSNSNFSMLKYFNIEFYETEQGNRTIACAASVDPNQDGYYFKGE